jgi:hypothetical protein
MTRCRVCGCTEDRACDPPCGWEPGEGNVCSSCAAVAAHIVEWMGVALRANFTGLMREAKAQFAGEALLASPPPKRRRRK